MAEIKVFYDALRKTANGKGVGKSDGTLPEPLEETQHVWSIFLPCDPRSRRCNLLSDDLFHLPDFFLNLAGQLLGLALVRQVRVAGDLTYFFFHIAFTS
ncbi:MAG: hypothetical protein PVSMB1_11400 [Gemmatimonadaceae bacterium]